MLTKLQAPGANYDLLFPSDYTVQRLIALDLLAELNHANIPNIENIDKNILICPMIWAADTAFPICGAR